MPVGFQQKPEVNYRVNTQVFGTVAAGLSRLEGSDGYLCPRLMALDRMPKGLDNVKQELDIVSVSLTSLTNLRDALTAILQPIEVATRVLQDRLDSLGRHRGVCSLPTEILSRIFELGVWAEPITTRHDFAFGISHVCRRFRAIALDSPRLWSVVTNVQTPEQIDASLSRSKAVKLLVIILAGGYRDDWRPRSTLKELMVATVPHRSRWTEFRCQVSEWDVRKVQDMAALYPELTFPSLERFELSLSDCDSDYDRWNETRVELQSVVTRWYFPKLLQFDTRNVLPGLQDGGRLTSCVLRLDMLQGVVQDLTTILIFLERSPQLEELSLYISGYRGGDTGEYPVLLPCLTTLSVIDTERGSYRTFCPSTFLRSVQTPNLLILNVELGPCCRIQQWLQALPVYSLSKGGFDCPSLLEVHIRAEEPLNAQRLFTAFSDLANLRVLSIHVTRLDFDNLHHLPAFTALQTLSLEFLHVYLSDTFATLLLERWHRMRYRTQFQLRLAGQVHHRVKMDPSVVNRFMLEIGDNFHYRIPE